MDHLERYLQQGLENTNLAAPGIQRESYLLVEQLPEACQPNAFPLRNYNQPYRLGSEEKSTVATFGPFRSIFETGSLEGRNNLTCRQRGQSCHTATFIEVVHRVLVMKVPTRSSHIPRSLAFIRYSSTASRSILCASSKSEPHDDTPSSGHSDTKVSPSFQTSTEISISSGGEDDRYATIFLL